MTEEESRELKIRDKVTTTELPPGERHVGMVVDTNWHHIKIKWDNGQIGISSHCGMMTKIQREVK